MLSMFISLLKSWSHVLRLALIVSHAEVSGTVTTELSHLQMITLSKVKTVLGVIIF